MRRSAKEWTRDGPQFWNRVFSCSADLNWNFMPFLVSEEQLHILGGVIMVWLSLLLLLWLARAAAPIDGNEDGRKEDFDQVPTKPTEPEADGKVYGTRNSARHGIIQFSQSTASLNVCTHLLKTCSGKAKEELLMIMGWRDEWMVIICGQSRGFRPEETRRSEEAKKGMEWNLRNKFICPTLNQQFFVSANAI